MARASLVPVVTMAFACAERRLAFLRTLVTASPVSCSGKWVNGHGHGDPDPVTVICQGPASVICRAIYAAPCGWPWGSGWQTPRTAKGPDRDAEEDGNRGNAHQAVHCSRPPPGHHRALPEPLTLPGKPSPDGQRKDGTAPTKKHLISC